VLIVVRALVVTAAAMPEKFLQIPLAAGPCLT